MVSKNSSSRSVAMKPGLTAFTRTLCGATSRARLRVIPTRPAFAAAYGNMPAVVRLAWIEAMLTIEPRRVAIIAGSTWRAISQAPFRSTSKTLSHSSTVISMGSA